MDEIDQYKAFAELIKKGQAVGEIAAHFGVKERLVTQRLAIANLISPILTAYRKGDLNAATLRMLTMATKAQQKEWWALVNDPDNYAPVGRQLKAWLFGGEDIPTRNAIFDLECYDGAIVSDLFGDDSYFADTSSFWEQQNKAIARAKDAYLAAGWEDVILLDIGAFFPSYDYPRVEKEDGGKVFVEITQRGEVVFHERRLARKDYDAKQTKSETAKLPAQAECTHAMNNYIGLHKHAAVRHALLGNDGLILRLIAAQMVAGTHLWQTRSEPQKSAKESIAESLQQNPSQTAFEEERNAVMELLQAARKKADAGNADEDEGIICYPAAADIFAALGEMSDDDVLRFLHVLVAETLPAHSELVEDLGATLEIDITGMWSPDQTFFDLLRNKSALNAMVGELAGKEVAKANTSATAKVQKAVLQSCLDGTRPAKVKNWIPRYMQFPAQTYLNAPDTWVDS